MEILIRNIAKEFVVLDPNNKAVIEKNDSSLYQRIEKTYSGFKRHELVSAHEFSADWTTWEMHPHGDEIIVLLSGITTLSFKLPHAEKSVTLSDEGSYIIVPKGIWHTAKTKGPCKLLFITPGEGTVNSENPEAIL